MSFEEMQQQLPQEVDKECFKIFCSLMFKHGITEVFIKGNSFKFLTPNGNRGYAVPYSTVNNIQSLAATH